MPVQRQNGSFLKFLEKGPGVRPEVIQQKRQEKTSSLLKSTSNANIFAPSGTQKMLVVLANFSDTSPSHTHRVLII
jgi:hypothetical protein